MTIKRLLIAGLAVAGFAVTAPALAQMKLSGFYIGGGGGQTNADLDNPSINAQVLRVPGIRSAVTSSDERDSAWKLFAGYQFHPNFAAELSYADLGKYSTVTTTTPAGTFNGELKINNTWSADLLGIWPLANNFSIFGKVGLLYSEAKVSATGRDGFGVVRTVSSKDEDWNYKLGVGVGYEFTPNIGVRGEWERYRVSDGNGGNGDLDLWSVSIRYKF